MVAGNFGQPAGAALMGDDLREALPPMAVLRVNTGTPWQIFDRDIRGQTIYPEKAVTLNVLTRIELEHLGRKLGFHVVVRVPKSRVKVEKEADAVALTWLYHYLADRISATSYWKFFEATWLDWTEGPSEPAVQDGYRAFECRTELTAKLSGDFIAACDYARKVEARFDAARKSLGYAASQNTAYWFSQTLTEARQNFRVLEIVSDCSGDMGGYSSSDIRNALRDYEELGRRKIESNHTYQVTLRDLQRVVHGVTFPSTWAKRPALPY